MVLSSGRIFAASGYLCSLFSLFGPAVCPAACGCSCFKPFLTSKCCQEKQSKGGNRDFDSKNASHLFALQALLQTRLSDPQGPPLEARCLAGFLLAKRGLRISRESCSQVKGSQFGFRFEVRGGPTCLTSAFGFVVRGTVTTAAAAAAAVAPPAPLTPPCAYTYLLPLTLPPPPPQPPAPPPHPWSRLLLVTTASTIMITTTTTTTPAATATATATATTATATATATVAATATTASTTTRVVRPWRLVVFSGSRVQNAGFLRVLRSCS